MFKYSLFEIIDSLKKELTPIKGLNHFSEEQLKFLLAKCVTYGKSNGTLTVPHFQMNETWDEVYVSYYGQTYTFKTDRYLINLGFTPSVNDYLGIAFENYPIRPNTNQAYCLKQIISYVKGKVFIYSEEEIFKSLAELSNKSYSNLTGSIEFKLVGNSTPILEINLYTASVEKIYVSLSRMVLNEIILLDKELADQ